MKSLIVAISFVIAASSICLAEVYEYTDSHGVVHFTDDISKVPKKERTSRIKSGTPSLTSSEAKTVEAMMLLEQTRGQDIPVQDMPDFKKKVNQFRELLKEEVGDPAEPKNSRLSTPEGALNLLLEGLRNGDFALIKSSFVGTQWEKRGYTQLTKPQLAELGRHLSSLAILDKRMDEHSAVFSVRNNKKGVDYNIRFIKLFDNWKISEI